MDSTGKQVIVRHPFDTANAVIAAIVMLIVFTIYYLTKQPTFSFWDSGEFVACSYILGVPHPPGSPLYILLGRVFSILPLAADISVRVNMLSVVTSAVATLFGYLITVRLVRFWYDNPFDLKNRIVAYIAGFTGALFMAFSNTNWTNSTEAEVYAPAIMIMAVIFWLALKYFENRDLASSTKYMLLLMYFAILGVGIHLTLYIIVPVVALFFILNKEAGLRDWALVSLFFFVELFLIIELSARPGEIPFYIPILIIFIFYLFYIFASQIKDKAVTVSLVLFLVSLYPMLFIIIDALSTSITGRGSAPFLETLAGIPIGLLGFIALSVWGLFSVYKYFTVGKDVGQKNIYLIVASFSLAPVVFHLIGAAFREVHGYEPFLGLTALIMVGLAVLLWRKINWTILIGIVAVSMVILGFWQFIYGLIFGAVAIVALGFKLKEKRWQVALSIIILAVIGYSVHIYIPIRSAHDPKIDENDPETATAFINYLERKQYGSESMAHRMFERRGEWENQFGNHRRMGFWYFFKDQYGLDGPRFFIILMLGLFGIWELIRRKPNIGLPFLVLIVLCTVGLVLYMNFADGTKQDPGSGYDYLEVRDRDYFFTPGFVFFGLAIGLGIAGFIELVRDTFAKSSTGIQNTAFGFVSLLVLMPLFPLVNNYFVNDRSDNYIPYDYAYNYLTTCSENAILVTNGDNDTFPIWCIQEVDSVRTDVKNVNLSLSNTHWYIKQLRDTYNLLPDRLEDTLIDRLRPYRDQHNRVFRIQDQVMDMILYYNRDRYDIFYAVSVPEKSRKFRGNSINDSLVLMGLTHKYDADFPGRFAFDRTAELMYEEYRFRGLDDTTIYKDETTRRLVTNYANGFLKLADSLRRAGDFEGAMEHIKKGLVRIPKSYDIYAYTSQMLAEWGRRDTLEAFVDNARIDNKRNLYFNYAMSAKMEGNLDEAIEIYEMTLEKYPEYREAYYALVRSYYDNRQYEEMHRTVVEWLQRHPEDEVSQDLLDQMQSQRMPIQERQDNDS